MQELSCGNAFDKADSNNNVPDYSSGEFKSDSSRYNNKNNNANHHRNNRGDNSNYIDIIAVPRCFNCRKLIIFQRNVKKMGIRTTY